MGCCVSCCKGCCWNPKCFKCILYILIAIFIPPLRVAMQYEVKSKEFWICLLLTAMGDIPGIIYSIYVTSQTHNSSTGRNSSAGNRRPSI